MKWIRLSTGLRISLVFGILLVALLANRIVADPVGPSIDYITHSSGSSTSGFLVDNSSHTGGVIAKMNLDVRQQNPHWKAYVGNITGALVLEDAANYSIYEWSLAGIQGEVYATRATTMTWSGIACANQENLNLEMLQMNHTSTFASVDNITNTFDDDTGDHAQFYAGSDLIAADTCVYTTNLYMNDTAQAAGSASWEEVVLFQNSTNSTIYTAIIDENEYAYMNSSFFDYQILLPEKAEPTFTGATAYYFYVELV